MAAYLSFGLKPVLNVMTRLASARFVQFVSAVTDQILNGRVGFRLVHGV
jgi:hypothetical protein